MNKPTIAIPVFVCGNGLGETGWTAWLPLSAVGTPRRRLRATLIRAARYARVNGQRGTGMAMLHHTRNYVYA